MGDLRRAFGAERSDPPTAPPASIADQATALWLPFLEVTGDPQDPAHAARAGDLIQAALGPYLDSASTSEEEP